MVDRATGDPSKPGGGGTHISLKELDPFPYEGPVTAYEGMYENPCKGPIDAFVCPSEPVRGVVPGNGIMAATSYRGCLGDSMYNTYEAMRPNNGDYTFPVRGILTNGLYELVDIASMTDGTSNTMILSEAGITPNWGESAAVLHGGIARTASTTITAGHAAACLAKREGSGILTPAPSQIGGRWVDAYSSYTGYYSRPVAKQIFSL